MGDKQSEGRKNNAAIPVDQWESKGMAGDKTKDRKAGASKPTEQPYGAVTAKP